MSSKERASRLLETLSLSIKNERLIPQGLEADVIRLFARLSGDEIVTAILHTRYLHALDMLIQTKKPDDLAQREDLTSVEVSQTFLEATVLLAAAIEAKLMGDAEVRTFIGVLKDHHMRHHFLNAASDHFAWSSSNILWDVLTDELVTN